MNIISTDELVKLLDNYDKHTFIGVESETIPTVNQKGRESKITCIDKFGCSPKSVRKVAEFTCGLGYDYKHVISTRLAKEGKTIDEYKAGDTWHVPVDGTKNLRMHPATGELYVWLFLIANGQPKAAYYNAETGQQIDREALKEFLPVEKAPTNQGLDEGHEVQVRLFKLASIKKIKMDGKELIVKAPQI